MITYEKRDSKNGGDIWVVDGTYYYSHPAAAGLKAAELMGRKDLITASQEALEGVYLGDLRADEQTIQKVIKYQKTQL